MAHERVLISKLFNCCESIVFYFHLYNFSTMIFNKLHHFISHFTNRRKSFSFFSCFAYQVSRVNMISILFADIIKSEFDLIHLSVFPFFSLLMFHSLLSCRLTFDGRVESEQKKKRKATLARMSSSSSSVTMKIGKREAFTFQLLNHDIFLLITKNRSGGGRKCLDSLEWDLILTLLSRSTISSEVAHSIRLSDPLTFSFLLIEGWASEDKRQWRSVSHHRNALKSIRNYILTLTNFLLNGFSDLRFNFLSNNEQKTFSSWDLKFCMLFLINFLLFYYSQISRVRCSSCDCVNILPISSYKILNDKTQRNGNTIATISIKWIFW